MSMIIKLRRDISSEWSRVNPVLAEGEPGYENDTGRFKIGDGSSRWRDLTYFLPGNYIPPGDIPVTEQMLLDHINSVLPHPVYDDGPSLLLLYSNAKV